MSKSKDTAACLPILPNLTSFRPPPHLRRRVQTSIGDQPSMTRQEFKDDCDINRIMAKFQITGALAHFARFSPEYFDATANDFQEAQNLVLRARSMFEALPSAIRKECATPEGFLTFVQDPANADRLRELGLREAPPPTTTAPAPSTPVPVPA